MKVEARLFEIVTAFFFLVGDRLRGARPASRSAWPGCSSPAACALIVGTYFRFVARRLEERPEDNPEAEVSDGAGDVGFFSPGSYWPIALAGVGRRCWPSRWRSSTSGRS